MMLHSRETLSIDSLADVEINGADVRIGDGGSQRVTIIPSADCYVKYAARAIEHWNGEPPTSLGEAIDRIAAALAAKGNRP
jgi:hypothetical protein